MKRCFPILFLLFGYLPLLFAQKEVQLITQEKDLGIITGISYSPNGKILASQSDKDNAIKVWDVQSGRLIGALKGHSGPINDISFCPCGDYIASGAQDRKVYIWNLNTWDIEDSISGAHSIEHVQYLNDEVIVFSDHSGQVKMRKDGNITSIEGVPKQIADITKEAGNLVIAGGKQVLIIGKDGGTSSFQHNDEIVEVRTTGGRIAVGDKSGNLGLYSLSGEQLKLLPAHSKAMTAFDIDLSKSVAVTSSSDKTTIIWDTKTWKQKAVVGNDQDKMPEAIRAIELSPDGNTVASSAFSFSLLQHSKTKDNSIKIWNASTGKLYKELKGEVNPLQSFCFHPNENMLYTIQNDRLSVWDLDHGERGVEITLHEREITKPTLTEKVDKSVSSDKITKGFGKLKGLATGKVGIGDLGLKEKAKEKSVEAGSKAVRKRIHALDRIYVSDSGNFIVTQLLEDDLRLYGFRENELMHLTRIDPHQKTIINDVSLDPMERYIALAGSGDDAISIIDMQSGYFVKTLSTKKANPNKLDFMEARALSFDTKGNRLSALFNTGLIMVWDVDSWELLVQVDLKGGFTKHAFLNYSKDGSYFSVPSALGVIQVDATLLLPMTKQQPKIKGEPILTHVASDYIVSKEKTHLNFLNIGTNKTVSTPNFDTDLIASVEFNSFGFVGVGMKSGELRIYDPESGKERFTMVSSGENAIFKTPENFYKVTKEGASLVIFRVGGDAFPFEQFDAKFNRPDIVLTAMNSSEPALIDLYHSAYQKRLKKLGVNEEDLSENVHLPQLEVKNTRSIPLITDKTTLTLDLHASDNKMDLKKLNIWINDVPFYGAAGKSVSGTTHEEKVEIQLVSGLNKVQVSCTNENGTESYKQTFDIDCTVPSESNLYIISIGTSKYKDNEFDLNYAAKDASDVSGLYTKDSRHYANIYTKTLVDEQVTRLNILSLKSFLKKATINDVVVVFIAGHGILDSKLDYFYGTHDIDFNNPSVGGLRYDQIEAILDGIKPLKKILIMDTCHSGEVEKDEVEESEEVIEGTDIVFRAVGPGIKEKSGASPTRMMNELFNDLRRGTGTTVIASAGGAEYAIESDQWKNGLFTYCFIDALKNEKADLNSDGKVMLSEMQSWVRDQVFELSGGVQSPTTRIQNIALDYRLW